MSFQPVVPFGGYSGWAFLNRTREAQQETFNRAPQIQRETDYFAENIGKLKNAEELVADRRLLRLRIHNQKMTVAARAMAERKTLGQR